MSCYHETIVSAPGSEENMIADAIRAIRLVDFVKHEYPCNASYPVEALACYFSVNPRDTKLASKETMMKVMGEMYESHPGNNIANIFTSYLHKHQLRKFVVVDLDRKSEYPRIRSRLAELNLTPYYVIETRGGYH